MTERPLKHPDPAGVAPAPASPAESHAPISPVLLSNAPIVIGSTVVVVNALGIVDPLPTSVRTIRTTVWDADVWALLSRGEWRPLRDLRVVASPETPAAIPPAPDQPPAPTEAKAAPG